jgi:hypothetical protein
MNRPFPVTYRRALDPTLIRVEARFVGPVPPDRRDVMLSPPADWAKLGEGGGLSGDGIAPPQSGVSLHSSGGTGTTSLYWVFAGAVVDVRALFTLENVLHYMHSTMAPLQEVVIQTRLVDDDYITPEAFPPLFHPPPFALLLDVTGRGMDLTVEFAQPGPEEAVAEQVMARVGDWFCAASVGAYGDSRVAPGDTRFLIGQEPTWGPAGLSFYLDVARGNEAAFDGLVNVLHKAHYDLAPLLSVTLES